MCRTTVLVLLLLCFFSTRAQEPDYMYEFGVGGGLSWVYGDINKSKALYKPGGAISILARYNANPRWAFVADISTFGIKGDCKDFDDVFPESHPRSFDNRAWMLSIRPEIHFWNYGWVNDYREKKHLVPFLTSGIGGGFSSGDGDTGALFALQVGAGAKWKLSPRVNAQLTCLFCRTFGDKADGITDPYALGSNTWANSDWIGSLVLSMTFDFKERCMSCNKE